MKDFCLTQSSIGQFIQLVYDLMKEPKKYRVNIVEWRDKRSLSQNNMYWKWLGEIDKQSPLKCDSGSFKGSELWAEVFKKYYCPAKTITNGETELEVKSTTLLDVGEMTFYLNKIEQWCIDRGITLTIPQDSEYYKLMEKQNV